MKPNNPKEFYSVKHSQTTITELMIPSYANFGGKIHGGILLSLMDKVAYACASRHAGTYCVTVSVDEVNFLAPVEVGDLVSMHASVNYVGNTSLVVGIRVESENVKTREVKHTNTSYFTMVAKDEDTNKPKQVPGLILENHVQLRRFIEAIKRREIKKRYAHEFDNIKAFENLDDEISLLDNERCILDLNHAK
ncbi:acyl-CoA thioesterase [Solitalea lacus]|uniref:acyl-CoA thioesterase n=1 Tax=Solitalea lacus TaxID=2911172 RepID=UPI001EDB7C91|nr:acyl-CoA thioesterase [Solitalea lacus]UKJ06016.1 acyl-CoA thioesterase [Solitalea lacus]